MLMPVMFSLALSHFLTGIFLHHNSGFHIFLMISAVNILHKQRLLHFVLCLRTVYTALRDGYRWKSHAGPGPFLLDARGAPDKAAGEERA